jgi:ADP-heptose:LPS heptosyltransferase
MNNISARERFGFGLVNGKPYPLNELANEWYLMGINDNVKKANSKTYHKLMHDICRLEYRNTKPYLAITSELAAKTELIKKNIGLDMFKKFILVNLGGGNRWQYKKWTIEGYSELLNNLTLSVRNTAIGVIAGAEDRTFYYETVRLISKKDHTLLLGCDNSLEDFISIISLADKVFTSDSLALHISTALGKFTVCIVGPTSHSELDIFGNGKIIYSSKVDCLSCYLNTCNKKVNCMNTVFAKEVIGYLL